MDALTTITHGPAGYTITTGQDAPLARDAHRDQALRVLLHRGLTAVAAVEALNAAVRLGRFTIAHLGGLQGQGDGKPVALPEPGDIQVATRWRQVETYRAALIRSEQLAYKAGVLARSLNATRSRVPDTAKYQEIRDRAYRKYRAAADEHEQAANAAAAAADAAFAIAPAAAERVWLSLETYNARLHRELHTHRQRRAQAG